MDSKNLALCYALRHPPAGSTKMPFKEILGHVLKTDGTRPSIDAVKKSVANFHAERADVGRKSGWRKTTPTEDRKIINKFKELRPPGHGIDSRTLHTALPRVIKRKIGRKTLIRRLSEKGFNAEKKIQKSDPGTALMIKRRDFGILHEDKTEARWKTVLQAVGDIKEFTHYPLDLRPKLLRLPASWTYMAKAEKMTSAFGRPKRWFPTSDYKRAKKQKVFGLTTSNGKSLAFLIPTPWNTEVWAGLLRHYVGPFLKHTFPGKTSFQILLDGERLLHGPAAVIAFAELGITILPDWPKYSPELNPQENVWPLAETRLRKAELDDDTFEKFGERCVTAVKSYEHGEKLVGSMAKRIKDLIAANGGPIRQ